MIGLAGGWSQSTEFFKPSKNPICKHIWGTICFSLNKSRIGFHLLRGSRFYHGPRKCSRIPWTFGWDYLGNLFLSLPSIHLRSALHCLDRGCIFHCGHSTISYVFLSWDFGNTVVWNSVACRISRTHWAAKQNLLETAICSWAMKRNLPTH